MQNKLYNQLIGRGHRLALRHIALATFLFAFCSCKSTDFKALSKGILQGAGNGGLSTQEVALGLREALKEGASSAAVSASLKDGFFKNSRIAIPWPSEVRNVKSTLDSLGLNSLTNQFVKSMNRGAEKAAQQAKPIFWKAIGGMSITDAWGILKGPKNAATHYLDRKTRSSLSQLFMPVVKSSLEDVSATRYWRDITSQYNQIPLVKPVRTDLNRYVTDKALDGLFYLVAQEEADIRKDPMKYTSDIIRRVFSQQ